MTTGGAFFGHRERLGTESEFIFSFRASLFVAVRRWELLITFGHIETMGRDRLMGARPAGAHGCRCLSASPSVNTEMGVK